MRMRRRIDYALTRARAAASGNVLGAITLASPRLQRLTQAMRTLYGPSGVTDGVGRPERRAGPG